MDINEDSLYLTIPFILIIIWKGNNNNINVMLQTEKVDNRNKIYVKLYG